MNVKFSRSIRYLKFLNFKKDVNVQCVTSNNYRYMYTGKLPLQMYIHCVYDIILNRTLFVNDQWPKQSFRWHIEYRNFPIKKCDGRADGRQLSIFNDQWSKCVKSEFMGQYYTKKSIFRTFVLLQRKAEGWVLQIAILGVSSNNYCNTFKPYNRR